MNEYDERLAAAAEVAVAVEYEGDTQAVDRKGAQIERAMRRDRLHIGKDAREFRWKELAQRPEEHAES